MQKSCDSAERESESLPVGRKLCRTLPASSAEFQKDAQGPARSSQSPGASFLEKWEIQARKDTRQTRGAFLKAQAEMTSSFGRRPTTWCWKSLPSSASHLSLQQLFAGHQACVKYPEKCSSGPFNPSDNPEMSAPGT